MRWRSDLVGPADPADLGTGATNTVTTIGPMKRSRIDVMPKVADRTVERNRYVVALYWPHGDCETNTGGSCGSPYGHHRGHPQRGHERARGGRLRSPLHRGGGASRRC